MLRSWITAGLIAIAPAAAAAQTCLGVPTSHGQSAFAGQMGVTRGAHLYGVEASFHLPHDIAVLGRFQLINPEQGENTTLFGGGVAWTLPGSKPSLCPVVGVEYATWVGPGAAPLPGFPDQGDDFNELSIPVGVGLGMTFRGRVVDTTLYGVPQFVWRRLEHDAPYGTEDAVHETETGMTALVGLNLSRGLLFGGAAGQFASFEHSDPRIILQLGVMLGGPPRAGH